MQEQEVHEVPRALGASVVYLGGGAGAGEQHRAQGGAGMLGGAGVAESQKNKAIS